MLLPHCLKNLTTLSSIYDKICKQIVSVQYILTLFSTAWVCMMFPLSFCFCDQPDFPCFWPFFYFLSLGFQLPPTSSANGVDILFFIFIVAFGECAEGAVLTLSFHLHIGIHSLLLKKHCLQFSPYLLGASQSLLLESCAFLTSTHSA